MSEPLVLDAPALLTFSDEEMRSERPARLLEAGDYPDKQLSLTESDLDAIVSRFSSAVPVKVEHTDSPLDPVGRVLRVWREGNALLGMLAFPDDLAGFLRRRGAGKLSVGLSREPLALLEVSLVLRPRVASAALLAAGSLSSEIVQLRAALSAREAEVSAREVDLQVSALKAAGRIVPASEAAARALLGSEAATVQMADGVPEPVASVFRRFLAAQPPGVIFGDLAPSAEDFGSFTQTEHTFLSKLGVDSAQVEALLNEERRTTQKEKNHAH